jgi:hypothetical protein
MAQSLEEMQPFLREHQERANGVRKEQLQHQAHVGKVVSELLSDPKWEMYARHLQVRKEKAEQQLEGATMRVMNAVDQVSLLNARVAHSRALESVRVYTECLTMVSDLVKTGQLAAEQLDT